MSYLWLDVTTILGWNRPAVGIVRVESECAAYALENDAGHQTRFCRFERGSERYIEVSREEVRAALDRIRQKRVSDELLRGARANTSLPAQPLERRLKSWALRLIWMLPGKLRAKVFTFAATRKSAFVAAVRGYYEMRVAVREFLRPSSVNAQMAPNLTEFTQGHKVPFAERDVYISLGLDWDQKDLVYLYMQKRQVGFKVLLFCYDIIPVKFPHLCVGDVASKFAKYFANLAWCADHVLCISECSREDLLSLLRELGTPIPETGVVRLGSEIQSPGDEPVSAEVVDVLGNKYILYVSTIERRKNHETLYRAYTRLLDRGAKDLPLLVFVGMAGWGVNELLSDINLDPRTKPYIRILNHVSDSDLSRLYKHAYFTVYPSLYEGWGLPVTEGLEYRKFCLASNAASLPEAGGGLVEYIDPWNVQAWADRIGWYSTNPEAVIEHERAITIGHVTTAWKDTAHSIYTVAQKCLGSV